MSAICFRVTFLPVECSICCCSNLKFAFILMAFSSSCFFSLSPFSLIRDFGKTEHSRTRFQKFPSIIRVIDMSDRNPPITATSVTFYIMLASCDWWISIRRVDSMYDWWKFWKRFRECFVFQSRVSTKTVVIPIEKIFSNRDSIRKAREAFLIQKGRTIDPDGLNIGEETC